MTELIKAIRISMELHAFYKQHFHKQHLAEIGKKTSKM